MPQVEIDDELHEYFRRHEELTGERLCDHLRRLLKDRVQHDGAAQSRTRSGTDLAEFLAILADVHLKYQDRFSRIANVRGRTRIYFALTAAEIEQSGSSTAPVEIPGTGWWVSSHNANALKRGILRKVFRAIGCSAEDCRKWLEQFDGVGGVPTDDFSWQQDGDDQGLQI